ncbi:tRNA adenosine(34) deaminase TadA [candidate division KSB1 bacterium]
MDRNLAQRPDEYWMRLALKQARLARGKDEVPVGALIVLNHKVLARGHNLTESKQDPLAHAEMQAIRRAAVKTGSWRLEGASLYVTLEPCAMCAGAIVLSRITRLVFGAADPKAGACGSLRDIVRDSRLNHRVEVTEGVLASEASELLSRFFKDLRRKTD